jgi:formiminotetrahydrofolate cyclodeaminase
MYLNRPIKEYLDDLAARKAAPGGGSAAALGASIGTGLMEMVANYTVGNVKYKDHEAKVANIIVKVEKFSQELQGLIDEDVAAYNKLASGRKKFKRDSSKLDSLYKDALEIPFKVCRITNECLKLCGELARYGNKNLITDVAIAAIMLECAFFSAKFNVYINLKYITDMDYVSEIHKILSSIEKAMPKLKEEILEECEGVITK